MFGKRPRLILAVATITAICLASVRLGTRPLWLDEAWSFYIAHLPIPEFMDAVHSDVNPILHYSAMWIWLKFGDSEFWIRFLSALCFTLTVPVAGLIGRTVSGQRAGLYAACLVATAPFLIRYARDARMYAMLTLLCSLALMCAVLIISQQSDRRPAVIGAGLRGQWRRWRQNAPTSYSRAKSDLLWAAYIAAAFGAMLTHNTAVLLPVTATLIFLVAIVSAPRFRWLRLRNLIIANAILLALYVFSISSLLGSIATFREWNPVQISFWRFRVSLLTAYTNEHLPSQAIVMAALCLAALWGWRRRKEWKWAGFVLIGSLVLPLMLMGISSIISREAFASRTIIWASIPFYVACAAGIARLPKVGLRRIVLAGLLLANLYGVLNVYTVPKFWQRTRNEPWDRVAHIVAEAASPDSAVVLCPNYISQPFNYYWRRHHRELIAVFGLVLDQEYLTVRQFEASANDVVAEWRKLDHQWRRLDSLLNDYPELWIVDRPGSEAGCALSDVQDALASRGHLITARSFEGIELSAYARSD